MIDAPVDDFESPATGGKTFRLKDQAGKIVVLYFYPKDNMPGCTKEATQFRDLHEEFLKAGAIIVGVSRDSLRSHENFKAKHDLPFDFLSDAEEHLCLRFEVIKQKVFYGNTIRGIERSTFVIDRQGVLKREWRGLKVQGHPKEVLKFVKTMKE